MDLLAGGCIPYRPGGQDLLVVRAETCRFNDVHLSTQRAEPLSGFGVPDDDVIDSRVIAVRLIGSRGDDLLPIGAEPRGIQLAPGLESMQQLPRLHIPNVCLVAAGRDNAFAVAA